MLLNVCFVFLVAKMGELCSAASLRSMAIGSNTYLDPKYDVVAKKIFRDDYLLLKFINSALCPTCKDSQRYSHIKQKSESQLPDTIDGKHIILDVLCQSDTGDQVIVEIQIAKEKHFDRRAQYYVSRVISSQLSTVPAVQEKPDVNQIQKNAAKPTSSTTESTTTTKKKPKSHHPDTEYAKLKPVHFIGILDFELFPNNADFISTHLILNNKTKENYLNLSTYTFIELPKLEKKGFKIDTYETFVEKMSYLFWFKRFKKEYQEGWNYLIANDPDIGQAAIYTNQANWNENEKMQLQAVIDNRRVMSSVICAYYDDAMQKGVQKGVQKSIDKIARRMLKNKEFTDDNIADALGKSVQEIANMRITLNLNGTSDSNEKLNEDEYLDSVEHLDRSIW